MTSTERLSVNVSTEVAATLRRIADRRGESITETVRRAVAYLNLVENVDRAGGEVSIRMPGDTPQVIKLL